MFQETDEAIDNPSEGTNTLASQEISSPKRTRPSTSTQDDTFAPPSAKRKRRKTERQEDETQTIMNTALQVLQSSVSTSSDPYFSYALYLANELRKYDPVTLAGVKRAFGDIIYDADMKMFSGTHHHQRDTTASLTTSTSVSGQTTPVLVDTSPERLEEDLSYVHQLLRM